MDLFLRLCADICIGLRLPSSVCLNQFYRMAMAQTVTSKQITKLILISFGKALLPFVRYDAEDGYQQDTKPMQNKW